MKEPILKAVAQPIKLFWAPFLPAALNFAIQAPLMFMLIPILKTNPIIFMGTIAIGHLICIAWGSKEPHLSTIIQAWGPMASKTHNIYPERGNKLAS